MFTFPEFCIVNELAQPLLDLCQRLGQDMFYGADESEDYADRAYRLVLLGCSCPAHHALDLPEDDDFVAAKAARNRMRLALATLVVDGEVRWDQAGERRVRDVIKDALGDTPRRRAAGTSFSGRPERPLRDDAHLNIGQTEVMFKLIFGATGWRHSAPIAFFNGQSNVRTAAAYVADSIRSSRRTKSAGTHSHAAASVGEIAEMIREARALIIVRDPGRWHQLRTECAVWATRPMASVFGEGDDLDRHELRQVDGEAGFLDPAGLVCEPELPWLSKALVLEEDGPMYAALTYLCAAADKQVPAVTDWLSDVEGTVPVSEELIDWFDGVRRGRRRKTAFTAARALPREDLAGLLEDTRDYLRILQPERWEMLTGRARRRVG